MEGEEQEPSRLLEPAGDISRAFLNAYGGLKAYKDYLKGLLDPSILLQGHQGTEEQLLLKLRDECGPVPYCFDFFNIRDRRRFEMTMGVRFAVYKPTKKHQYLKKIHNFALYDEISGQKTQIRYFVIKPLDGVECLFDAGPGFEQVIQDPQQEFKAISRKRLWVERCYLCTAARLLDLSLEHSHEDERQVVSLQQLCYERGPVKALLEACDPDVAGIILATQVGSKNVQSEKLSNHIFNRIRLEQRPDSEVSLTDRWLVLGVGLLQYLYLFAPAAEERIISTELQSKQRCDAKKEFVEQKWSKAEEDLPNGRKPTSAELEQMLSPCHCETCTVKAPTYVNNLPPKGPQKQYRTRLTLVEGLKMLGWLTPDMQKKLDACCKLSVGVLDIESVSLRECSSEHETLAETVLPLSHNRFSSHNRICQLPSLFCHLDGMGEKDEAEHHRMFKVGQCEDLVGQCGAYVDHLLARQSLAAAKKSALLEPLTRLLKGLKQAHFAHFSDNVHLLPERSPEEGGLNKGDAAAGDYDEEDDDGNPSDGEDSGLDSEEEEEMDTEDDDAEEEEIQDKKHKSSSAAREEEEKEEKRSDSLCVIAADQAWRVSIFGMVERKAKELIDDLVIFACYGSG